MATRKSNERRFTLWDDLPDGGRRYYRLIPGKVRGYARYVKAVDAHENTLTIVQEVYDNEGRLIAIHQKFPEDIGHQAIGLEDEA